MTRTIRARFRGGVLEPMDRIDLPEGEEVTVTITKEPSGEDVEAFRKAAGSWRKTMPEAKTFIRQVYASRRAGTRSRARS